MSSILLAVDLSASADKVLAATEALALTSAERLILLHVAAPDPVEFVPYRDGPQHERDFRAEHLKSERALIESMSHRFEREGLEIRSVVVEGHTAKKILAEAERHEADMIVIGSHGHGRLHDLLLGSVSEEVLRGAKMPVLIVPVHERAS